MGGGRSREIGHLREDRSEHRLLKRPLGRRRHQPVLVRRWLRRALLGLVAEQSEELEGWPAAASATAVISGRISVEYGDELGVVHAALVLRGELEPRRRLTDERRTEDGREPCPARARAALGLTVAPGRLMGQVEGKGQAGV